MSIYHIIGIFGSILVGLAFIPQTYKIIKTNNVKDVSPYFISINLLSSTSMVVYGIHYLIIPVIIANLSVLINNIVIGVYMCKNRNK